MMAHSRETKENKIEIYYPKTVVVKDIKENGLLLTHSEIQKTIEILKTQSDKRFSKNELKSLGLPDNYSIIKDENRYFVVYKKQTYLGQGGQGKVKIAQYIGSSSENNSPIWSLGKLFALKVVEVEDNLKRQTSQATIEKERNFLEKLGRAHTKIIERSKKGIVTFQFLQELMPGEDLFSYLKEGHGTHYRRISLEAAIKILMSALVEMMFIHSKGILHCDIKPENAIYDPINAKISFIDFGLSLAMDKNGQAQAEPCGSSEFMAPEVSKGIYDEKTEIYALGKFYRDVLYHVNVRYRSSDYSDLCHVSQMMLRSSQFRPTGKYLKRYFENLMSKVAVDNTELIKEIKQENEVQISKLEQLNQATAWLNKCVRFEFSEQYNFHETGRKKHSGDLQKLCQDFKVLLDKMIDNNSKDNHISFIKLVSLVEKEFLRLQRNYCSPGLLTNGKPPIQFINHLNQDKNNHHYSRMLGLILKSVYEKYPFLLGDYIPLQEWVVEIKSNDNYQFSFLQQKAKLKPL